MPTTDVNGVLIGDDTFTEYSGLTVSANNGYFLPAQDVTAWRWASIQINGTWVGTLNFQGSNDNITFYPVRLENKSTLIKSSVAVSNGLYEGPIGFRYIAIQATPWTSGTATGVADFHRVPPPISNSANTVDNSQWSLLYSTTQTGVSSWAGTGDLNTSSYSQLIINWNLSAITGTSIKIAPSRKDNIGNYIALVIGTALTNPGAQVFSVGAGMTTAHGLGNTAAVTAVLVAITSVTFTLDVWAR